MIDSLLNLAGLGRQPYYGPGTTGRTDTPQQPARVTPATGGYRYAGQGDHETEAEFFARMRAAQTGRPTTRPPTRADEDYAAKLAALGIGGRTVTIGGGTKVSYPLGCGRCGGGVNPTDIYCQWCGARLQADQPAPRAQAQAPHLFYAQQATQARMIVPSQQAMQAQQYRMPTSLSPQQRFAAVYGSARSYGMRGLAGLGASGHVGDAPRGLPSHRVTIGDGSVGTKQTLEAMQKLAIEASRDPYFFDFVRSLVQDRANKDYEGEAATIFDKVARHVRYSLDPLGLELVADPRWTMFVFGNGDCDDHATLIAAMALALGHRAAFRTVATDYDVPGIEAPWVHVYALIGVQRGGGVEWHAADTTQPGGYLGWEPTGVSKVGTWLIAT